MADLLKKERQDAVVTINDVVLQDGRELGRFDAVIGSIQYMFIRSFSFDRDNIEVLVDLLVTARDRTSLLPSRRQPEGFAVTLAVYDGLRGG